MSQRHATATKTCLVHTKATRIRDVYRGHVGGTKSQHLHTRENVTGTCSRDMLQRHVPSCELIARMVHSFGNAQHALRYYIVEVKWRPSKEESVEDDSPAKNPEDNGQISCFSLCTSTKNKPIRSLKNRFSERYFIPSLFPSEWNDVNCGNTNEMSMWPSQWIAI